MRIFAKRDKSFYCCKCLEETVVLHRDWYGICSMYSHLNWEFRPFFQWDDKKGFDYKNFLKTKRKMIKNCKRGNIHEGCIGCNDLVKKEWSGKCDKIYHIHFRLSKKCNAKCIYCNDNPDNENPDRLFLNDLKILIKNGIVDKNALMEFGGGEFTLHDEFDEIFRYLLDNGYRRYKVYTSCLRHSKELEEALGYGQCEVIISADAGDRETFIKMKQADTYDRFFKNLSSYVLAQNENKSQVKLKYLICSGINASEEKIDLFLQKSKEIGIKNVIFDVQAQDLIRMQKSPQKKLLETICSLIKYAKQTAENKYNLIFEDFNNLQQLERLFPEFFD